VGDPYVADSADGADWSWGLWAVDVTTTDASGNEHVESFYQARLGGNKINEEQQLAIATGTQLYHLTGQGPAAAAVTFKDQGTLMTGDATFHVAIGQGISPTWDGSFNLGSSSASLSFDAAGQVNMDGSVSAPVVQNYNLNAFGFNLPNPPPDPADRVVEGHLYGSGAGTDPITGIAVEFLFRHPDGPTVVGAGGADLH
jgi:hypothetical protein